MTSAKTMNKGVLKIDGSFFYERKRTSDFRLAYHKRTLIVGADRVGFVPNSEVS